MGLQDIVYSKNRRAAEAKRDLFVEWLLCYCFSNQSIEFKTVVMCLTFSILLNR